MGKTVVAAALMRRYRGCASRAGCRLRYWKPVQTGIEVDDDTGTVRRLGGCAEGEVLDRGVRLERPLSPHLSARLAGQTIDVPGLVRLVEDQPAADRWIVEGAGGALVPLDSSMLMADLMALLGLPVLVVARSTLGTINHSLLTLEALARRRLAIAGVVMVGPRDDHNREAIESFGRTPVVGMLPPLEPLTPCTLDAWADGGLDPQERLRGYLQ